MTELDDMFLELKDTSEMMVDLAYSALLYNNKDIARLVLDLENEVDERNREIQRLAITKAIENQNVERALTMIRLANSMEVVADSALDIADVVLRDIVPHPILQMSIHDSDVIVLMATISPDSILCGDTLGRLKLASETGMWVMAVRRGSKWFYGANEYTQLLEGDVVLVRGPVESEEHFKELADGRSSEV